MAAPTIQSNATPWTGYTFGRLLELALREHGCTNAADATNTDPNLTPASTQELAAFQDLVREALMYLQETRERWWSISEATVTAEDDGTGKFPAVVLPADFARLVPGGVHVGGHPVEIIGQDTYLRSIRPDDEGGGIYLTDVRGERVFKGRIAVVHRAAATTALSLGLWGYPVQTAAWTAQLFYIATAANLTGLTDVVRVPNRLHPMISRYVSARRREQIGDINGAAARWDLFERKMNEIENIPPAEETVITLEQGYPED